VLAMVLKEGFRLFVVGLVLGLAATVASAVAVSSLLFGVKPADPLSYICSAAVVVAIAILAGHIPARRASRVDPAVALAMPRVMPGARSCRDFSPCRATPELCFGGRRGFPDRAGLPSSSAATHTDRRKPARPSDPFHKSRGIVALHGGNRQPKRA
jgi:hypothetical protein